MVNERTINEAGGSTLAPSARPSPSAPKTDDQRMDAQQTQIKYAKIWKGILNGQRQGKPVFICELEGYRRASASDTLAADWPPTLQIVRLIDQEHMNNKKIHDKADVLVFRTFNQHGFLGQLQERKLCAVIQLPSQTLLLSVSGKAGRLIGLLLPKDIVVFRPQVSSQQQKTQQQHLQEIEENHPSQLQLFPSSTGFGSLLQAVTINPPPIQQDKIVAKSRKCKICEDCAHKKRKPN